MLPHQVISAAQIKAARAILDWSQDELARSAMLSLSTVRSCEAGFVPRRSSIQQIRRTMEKAGIEFLRDDGVKRRHQGVTLYEGHDCAQLFCEDVLRVASEQQEPIYCAAPSLDALLATLGGSDATAPKMLEKLCNLTTIKCLLLEACNASALLSQVECRLTDDHRLGPSFYFVYGNIHVDVSYQGGQVRYFVRHHNPENAQRYQKHFMRVWQMSQFIQQSAA